LRQLPVLARRVHFYTARSANQDRTTQLQEVNAMGLIELLLLIFLVLLLVGALPAWPHSRSWGYYPSGGLGMVLLIVLILLILF
jgi:hypothetical protein